MAPTPSKKAAGKIDGRANTERLRALRLAAEATRKEAGIFGDRTVGEILHPPTGTVYVHVWRGARRPDPLVAPSPQSAAVPASDWAALAAWAATDQLDTFLRRTVSVNLSSPEAVKVKAARISELRASSQKVVNQD